MAPRVMNMLMVQSRPHKNAVYRIRGKSGKTDRRDISSAGGASKRGARRDEGHWRCAVMIRIAKMGAATGQVPK
jgi:hypothetical protein